MAILEEVVSGVREVLRLDYQVSLVLVEQSLSSASGISRTVDVAGTSVAQ